jgi:spore germination protein GerM
MRPSVRRSITSNLFLSLWGLATFVLFFMVLLLVYEMLQNGQQPLAALKTEPTNAAPQSKESPVFRPTTVVGEREIKLYYATAEADALTPQTIKMEFSDSTVENCRKALDLLMKAPQEGFSPVLPESTKIRAMYLLENGELVVDFGQELTLEHAQFKSVSVESLLVFGVVNTLTQEALQSPNNPVVRKVRILFDGEIPQDTFPAHLNISEPLLPNLDWVVESGNA